MMRAWLAGLLRIAAIAVCLPCTSTAGRAETLRIATYNVRNYVSTDRMTGDGFRPGYPKPEAEKRALRIVIRELDADVLVLQEMGPLPYLEELRRDLRREGVEYPHLFLVQGPDPDRHVAILSRRPPIATRRHEEIPIAYAPEAGARVKRGMLEVTFGTEAGEITVFAVHLKSRLTEQPGDPGSVERRAAEAVAIRESIRRRFPFPEVGRYLLLGDCNDTRDSRTLQLISRRGRSAILELLPAEDSRGESWTYRYEAADTYARYDHILVSAQLRGAVRNGLARIIDIPETRQASDHRPVVVTLDLEEAKGGG